MRSSWRGDSSGWAVVYEWKTNSGSKLQVDFMKFICKVTKRPKYNSLCQYKKITRYTTSTRYINMYGGNVYTDSIPLPLSFSGKLSKYLFEFLYYLLQSTHAYALIHPTGHAFYHLHLTSAAFNVYFNC